MKKSFKVGDEVKFKHISYPLGQPPVVTDQKGSVRNIHGEVATVYYMIPENGIFNTKDFPFCHLEPVSNAWQYDLCFDGFNHKIRWVRRVSDNETFKLGDIVQCGEHGVITCIEVDSKYAGGIKLQVDHRTDYWTCLATIQKAPPRKKLFTTEDGVDIYQGDKCWHVDKHFGLHECPGAGSEKSPNKRFSTKEAAKEYIIMNKPCLSFTDVEEFKRRELAAKMSRGYFPFPSLKDVVRKKLGL